ncbi:NmrA family NAD(P)-binding protein [Microterricola viridarii]|uniref:NAD(P)-dependent oxidoreductase n=1 Tax=Microterricola viridarii TaxID=412690 RepID=A0A0X8E391_9MICO|nr:NmrA family NAD(P)-binding protein [Microterricola viridarii]AMB59665.1 NAD(P)-dependent oxidoreductase [Microterricola viridarii]
MTLVITGATGQLGTLVIDALLRNGTPATQIVATGRNEQRLAALRERGVRTAVADYSDRVAFERAFAGAEAVLLISGSEVGQRVAQHRTVVEAAQAAGVARLVYTSAPRATSSALILAPEHKATEELIAASGIPATILRNGWYTENYAGALGQAATSGEIVASVGDGRVASASRADYADAAAVVLADASHVGQIYELSGDVAWTHADLAAVATELLARPVTYRNLSPEQHLAALADAGLDAGTAGFVVALDGNIRDGLLAETSGDLARLIGRPTTPLQEGLAPAADEALAA